eukprot:m.27444 g.27444  ORF g.27444 m.27444 type:complete len:342 (+) comp8538_c0_seq1:1975-3000(+)
MGSLPPHFMAAYWDEKAEQVSRASGKQAFVDQAGTLELLAAALERGAAIRPKPSQAQVQAHYDQHEQPEHSGDGGDGDGGGVGGAEATAEAAPGPEERDLGLLVAASHALFCLACDAQFEVRVALFESRLVEVGCMALKAVCGVVEPLDPDGGSVPSATDPSHEGTGQTQDRGGEGGEAAGEEEGGKEEEQWNDKPVAQLERVQMELVSALARLAGWGSLTKQIASEVLHYGTLPVLVSLIVPGRNVCVIVEALSALKRFTRGGRTKMAAFPGLLVRLLEFFNPTTPPNLCQAACAVLTQLAYVPSTATKLMMFGIVPKLLNEIGSGGRLGLLSTAWPSYP